MRNSKNRFKYIFIIIGLLIIIGIILYVFTADKNKIYNSNTSGIRLSTNTQKNDNYEDNEPVETLLSTYSTKILDNSSGRLTNIRITSEAINGTIINPGDTFSFNDIVGKPTAEKGYQEAEVIINHESEPGIGGGNCQVSSTLYNVVLSTQNLEIIERHEHGLDVAYVPDGKDATVSYGSLDFKFKNNNNYKIKIKTESDDKNITASIYKIK